jgi:hypothetical protein
MNPWLVPAALFAALALGSVGLGLLVLFRAAALVSFAERRARASREECEATLRAICDTVESLAAEIREIQKQPHAMAPVPASPRAGFNLSKRAQALRMHRRGETREQIALALEIPLQEVDLLLKVQQIVLSNV